jgi:hypothetical protein
MKAIIKIVTANKKFSKDQKDAIRRFSIILQEHNLSVVVTIKKKIKKSKILNLKAI